MSWTRSLGRDNDFELVLSSGDGHRLTLAEIRSRKETGSSTENASKNRSDALTQNASKISTDYDRFKDITTVTLRSVVSIPDDPRMAEFGPTFSILASFQYRGQVKAEIPQNILFAYQLYVFEGTKTRYRDLFNLNEEFIVLADGERLLGTMQRTELRDNVGGKYEVMSTPLTVEMFSKIVNATKVEMRVGTREFELKQNLLQALRDFLVRARS